MIPAEITAFERLKMTKLLKQRLKYPPYFFPNFYSQNNSTIVIVMVPKIATISKTIIRLRFEVKQPLNLRFLKLTGLMSSWKQSVKELAMLLSPKT